MLFKLLYNTVHVGPVCPDMAAAEDPCSSLLVK